MGLAGSRGGGGGTTLCVYPAVAKVEHKNAGDPL